MFLLPVRYLTCDDTDECISFILFYSLPARINGFLLCCLLLQGLSLVVSSCDGEDVLVSFGGYNGRYSNEVQSSYDSCWVAFIAFSFQRF